MRALLLFPSYTVLTFSSDLSATGTFWAHEKWDLPEPADFVTFSKKAQASGYYHSIETRPKYPYQCVTCSSLLPLPHQFSEY